jgi:hypothetical protein
LKAALGLAVLAALATTACQRPTALASNANGVGKETVPAAPPETPPPEIPAGELAAISAEQDGAAAPVDPSAGYTPKDTADTVTDYRPEVAGDIGALPPINDAAALAAAFVDWKAKAAASPGAYEQGAVQLGADSQEYRPSNAELLAAEAGDRLAAALQGADEATKAAIATTLGDAPEARVYRRFDYRHSDVMGSGRYFYASKPKEAALPG